MQVGRPNLLMLSKSNSDLSKSNGDISKSRSPDQHRQKIPLFKPKTLNEIYGQNRCRKSTDAFEKKSVSLQDAKEIKQSIEIIKNYQRVGGSVQIPKIRYQQIHEQRNKKTLNSLQQFIKQSGHEFQVQSQELSSSQIDDFLGTQYQNIPDQSRRCMSKKETNQLLTPQYTSVSRFQSRESNPFICKDDSSFTKCTQTNNGKFWNGKIALTASICYDSQNEQTKDQQQIPQQIQPFICQKYRYVECTNSKTKNAFLFESEKEKGLQVQQLCDKIMSSQKLGKLRKAKSKDRMMKIRFTQIWQNSEFTKFIGSIKGGDFSKEKIDKINLRNILKGETCATKKTVDVDNLKSRSKTLKQEL